MEDELGDLAVLAKVVVRAQGGELLEKREATRGRELDARNKEMAPSLPEGWQVRVSGTDLFCATFLTYAHSYDVDHVLDDDADVFEMSSAEGLELLVRLCLGPLQSRQTLDPGRRKTCRRSYRQLALLYRRSAGSYSRLRRRKART